MTETTTALVTGANKGIGREVAARLASLGTNVLLGSRDPHRGAAAAADLGPRVHPVTLDVTDPAGVLSAARWIEERFGRLDILVNNAGVSGDLAAQNPVSVELSAVREVFETNVFGVITVTAAMLPLLVRSPAARIVNVSSGLGSLARMTDPEDYFTTRPPLAAYVPSKTALNSLTVQYAKALRSRNILVNAADPGHRGRRRDRGRPPRHAARRRADRRLLRRARPGSLVSSPARNRGTDRRAALAS
jgi:NAD(P)-dependent dehydrogenase (short-subunit alcohol dehydrogenase family)